MDTRVIDVVIGLALVFALTSLLVTALQEAVSALLNLRGRNLWRAVVSFVGDNEAFAEALARHPLLVSLASGTREQRRHPSYIPTDVMVSALLAHLVERHAGGTRPATPAGLAAAVQAGAGANDAAAPNSDFARALAGLTHGVEQDWAAYEARLCAWFDAVGTRSAGWFRRQAQLSLFLIGFAVAAAANINPIVIADRLWQDDVFREAMVKAAGEAGAAHAQATASAPALEPAAGTPPPQDPDDPVPDDLPPPPGSMPGAPALASLLPRDGQPDCTALHEPAMQQVCRSLNDMAVMHNAGLPMGWAQPAVPKVWDDGCTGRPQEACGWSLPRLGNWLLVGWGWLLTAIACTIGAPFWFDLLGRLVKLRGAGARSEGARAPAGSDDGAPPSLLAR